jgi:hypothetical protein
MTVENIGNIADAYSNGKLPKCGMIISATREELMEVAGNLLYQEVAVVNASDARDGLCVAKRKYGDESLQKIFIAQIERCAEICNRIVKQGDKTYTPKEVLAIIDELLDGVKPEKGKAKQ